MSNGQENYSKFRWWTYYSRFKEEILEDKKYVIHNSCQDKVSSKVDELIRQRKLLPRCKERSHIENSEYNRLCKLIHYERKKAAEAAGGDSDLTEQANLGYKIKQCFVNKLNITYWVCLIIDQSCENHSTCWLASELA